MAEEQNIAGQQLQTKTEAQNAAMQTPAAGNESTASSTMFRNKLPERPMYNPLIGLTPSKFASVYAGGDQEHPLYTADAYGGMEFHPENIIYQKEPAKLQVDSGTFAWDVENRKKAINNRIDAVAQETTEYYKSIAPQFARTEDQKARLTQWLGGMYDFTGRSSVSFSSLFLSGYHGVLAQKRNYEEFSWDVFKTDLQNTAEGKAAYNEALAYLQDIENNPLYQEAAEQTGGDLYSFQKRLAFSKRNQDAYGLSEGARKVLSRYDELLQARDEDERRMQVGLAFDNDLTNIEEAARGKGDFPFLPKLNLTTKDEESSTIMMLSKFTGNVVGSLGAAYASGVVGGKLLSLAGKAKRLFSGADAVLLGARGGATAGLSIGAQLNEAAIVPPVFLSQYNQIRTEALLAGKDIDEANAIGFLAGVAESGLEFAGFKAFKRFYKADGVIRNYLLKNIIPEALQEGSQTLAEDMITNRFGVTSKQWTDIMSEVGLSMVAGAIGGGIFTGVKFRFAGAMAYLENVSDEFKETLANIATDDIEQGVNMAYGTAEAEDMLAPEEQKREARQKAKEEYNKLTADQKKAHDAFIESYAKLKEYYTKRAKRLNPKITQEQLANGWTAIKLMTQLQRQGNILVDHYYKAVNTMVSMLNKSSKLAKYNMREIKNTLFKHGLTKEQVENLTSEDAIKRNEAQWDLAENHVTDTLITQGVNETEAQLSARFLRSLMRDTTLINPSTTPLKFVKAMQTNIVNLQNATFFKMDLPAAFAPVTSDFDRQGSLLRMNDSQAREFAQNLADVLFDKKPDANQMKSLATQLYGNPQKDNGLKRLKQLAMTQYQMVSDVLNDMPSKLNKEFSPQEYTAMWLLNQFGYKWSQIFPMYGIAMHEGDDADTVFDETARENFKVPTAEDLKKLQRISDGLTMSPEQFTQERGAKATQLQYNAQEKQNIEQAAGFYEKNENLIVLRENKSGTAFHEYGHFALTTLLTDQIKLRRLGLLDDTAPLNIMYKRLADQMRRDGRVLTEREFQETVLDAAMRFMEKGQTTDPKMTALFSMLKSDGYVANKRLAASLMNNTEGKQLAKEQREGIEQEVGNILNSMTPTTILDKAYALRDMSMFKTGYNQQISAKSNADALKTTMVQGAREFIKTTPMRNNEQLLRNLAKAEKVNNILGIAMVAEEASREAIDFALETMLEGEDLRAMQEYADQAGEAAGSRVWKDGGMFFDATAQATPNEEYRANPSLVDEIKSKLPEFWKGAVDMVVKAYERYIQSAEGALGQTSNELRAILMKEVWQQSMSVQFFRNTLAPCANAFDERMSKMSKAQRTAELKEWRKWHADLGTGAKGCRERASQFIKDKLGIKAQQAWDDAMNLLDGNEAKYKEYLKDPSKNSMGFLYKGVKNLLIEAGIPADVLKTSNIFFPMEVKDYKGFTQDFFGHSVTYNFVDKERARIAKEYKKKVGKKNEKTGEYEITDAQEAELQLRLTDAINSNFQRKATDENRVTAFYRRTMQDYSKNPDMLKYYNDVFSTLDKYMDAVYRTVMMRNLIGKTDVTQNASDLYQQILNETDDKKAHGKIGMYLASLPLGRVSEDAMTNIMEKMRQLALRSKSDPKELFNFVRQVNQFTTLGSPLNALNQIQDLEFSLLLFGIQPTIEAVTKVLYKDKGAARLSEVGLETANEAYRVVDDNTLGRITKLVYSKTGFEWADRFGKEVTINAATIWAQKVVKEHLKNPSKETSRDWTELKYWLNECWPEPDYALLEAQGASEAEISQAREVWSQKRNALLTDLAEGKVTPDTKYLQWYMLTKLQPQNAATVPGLYNTSTAFGKTMYQFSTVFLRQLGFLGDYFKMKYKTQGSRAAFEAAARFIGFALMVGVPKEMIESILKGQTPQLGQSSLLSIGHVLALNSYTMSVIKNEGIFRGAISWTQPSFAALDNVSRDAMRAISLKSYKGYTFKSVPIAGMFIWYWALGGRQQSIKNGVALFHSPSTASEMKEIQRQAASSLAEMEGKENAE